MDPTTQAPASGADTSAETPAGPAKGSRESFLQKLGQKGIKSLGDFHPAAPKIRAQEAAAKAAAEAANPPAPEPAASDAGAPPVGHQTVGEVEKLRLELAELRGRLSATEKPEPQVEEKPDRLADPFVAAAVRELGEGAPERFLNQAADLLEKKRLYSFNLNIPEKAEAATKSIAQIDRVLDDLRYQADQAREIAELRAELERRKNAPQDLGAQIAKIKEAGLADEHLAKSHPRLLHALKTGAMNREKLEKRLDRIAAENVDEWVKHADAILDDLDDLYPDPPAAPATTANSRTAPANPAATAPRAAGGQATKRQPARTRAESRERFHERLRARG